MWEVPKIHTIRFRRKEFEVSFFFHLYAEQIAVEWTSSLAGGLWPKMTTHLPDVESHVTLIWVLIVLNFVFINLYLRPKSLVLLMDIKVNQIILSFGRKVEFIFKISLSLLSRKFGRNSPLMLSFTIYCICKWNLDDYG